VVAEVAAVAHTLTVEAPAAMVGRVT